MWSDKLIYTNEQRTYKAIYGLKHLFVYGFGWLIHFEVNRKHPQKIVL